MTYSPRWSLKMSREFFRRPTPSFVRSPGPGEEGDSFGLQVPPLAGLFRAGGLQPRFLGRPSIPPSFAERHWMDPGESFPAGIPHSSLSPPGPSRRAKTGGGQEFSRASNLGRDFKLRVFLANPSGFPVRTFPRKFQNAFSYGVDSSALLTSFTN
jgi:hypothetical protein